MARSSVLRAGFGAELDDLLARGATIDEIAARVEPGALERAGKPERLSRSAVGRAAKSRQGVLAAKRRADQALEADARGGPAVGRPRGPSRAGPRAPGGHRRAGGGRRRGPALARRSQGLGARAALARASPARWPTAGWRRPRSANARWRRASGERAAQAPGPVGRRCGSPSAARSRGRREAPRPAPLPGPLGQGQERPQGHRKEPANRPQLGRGLRLGDARRPRRRVAATSTISPTRST